MVTDIWECVKRGSGAVKLPGLRIRCANLQLFDWPVSKNLEIWQFLDALTECVAECTKGSRFSAGSRKFIHCAFSSC